MHQNTAPTVTHTEQQSNFFAIPSDKIAYPGILERIKFEQWHIFQELRTITKNINLINYASLLAVFPRMGIYAFRIPQSALAEKMGDLFKIPVPARNTISKWEKELERLEFLQIPKHVDWRRSKTKIRVITQKFWNVSRKGLENLSYTCPHVTKMTGTLERVKQVIPKDLKDPTVLVTKIRARETNVVQPVQNHAVSGQKNKKGEGGGTKKYSRPPKNKTGAPKKLNKFENSVGWWFFQNHSLNSYREAVILFGRFLELPPDDDYLQQLRRNWADCTDASRPGMTTALVKFLRALENGVTDVSSAPPLRIVENDFPRNVRKHDPEMEALLESFMFGKNYTGKFWKLHQDFVNGSEEHKDWMFENLDRLVSEHEIKK